MVRRLCVLLFTLLCVRPVVGQDSAPSHCNQAPPPDDQVASVLGLHPDVRMRQDCFRTTPSRLAPVPFELILHAAATRRSDFLPGTLPNTISTPTPDSLRRTVWLYRFAVDRAYEIPSSSPLQCREVKVTELVAKKLPILDPITPDPTAYRCEATVGEGWAYELQYVVPQTETQGLLSTELGYGKLTVSQVRD